jgi:hypothetical protein
MKKISVEYAHIYTNQDFNLECDVFKEQLDTLSQTTERSDVSLVVMVDDYSYPDPNFDYSSFVNHVEDSTKYIIDNLIRESELIKYCDIVLREINNPTLKSELTNWIMLNKKYPCSLFIATWYLIRLGKIEAELFGEDNTAEMLINILPSSFLKFENKGLEIIKSTKWAAFISSIQNIYIEGRSI